MRVRVVKSPFWHPLSPKVGDLGAVEAVKYASTQVEAWLVRLERTKAAWHLRRGELEPVFGGK